MNSDIDVLKEIVNKSSNIVFFGGAGVSTESNIPDFRSESGIYMTRNNYSYSPEVMLSHSFFVQHTEDFYDFYKAKMIYKTAKPNDAHISLAKLEEQGKLRAVITQNIDGLHQMAGSKNVLELHGSIYRNFCTRCGESYDLQYILDSSDDIPLCNRCRGAVKPDVVLYEENLDNEVLTKAINYIAEAEVLIIGGTSLMVYPAAGLVEYYKGDKLILINKSSTSYDYKANMIFNEGIGMVLKGILQYK
jgi:NAD-dependent deacetylase